MSVLHSSTPTPVTNSTDSSVNSHVNKTCNEVARLANRREPHPQTETDKSTRRTKNRRNLRANPALNRYSDHLVHQISSAKAQLRPVKLGVRATNKAGSGSQSTSGRIRLDLKCSDTQDNAVRLTSKIIGINATTH